MGHAGNEIIFRIMTCSGSRGDFSPSDDKGDRLCDDKCAKTKDTEDDQRRSYSFSHTNFPL